MSPPFYLRTKTDPVYEMLRSFLLSFKHVRIGKTKMLNDLKYIKQQKDLIDLFN
jgi:hypothetical protein